MVNLCASVSHANLVHSVQSRVLDPKNDEANPMSFAARQRHATQRISIRVCNIRYSALLKSSRVSRLLQAADLR